MSKVSRCYTEEDKGVFMDLLKQYKDVVENKKSDASTIRQKDQAWIKIVDAFNKSDLISQKRTVAQLKKWWSNMKQQQREAKTKENQARMGTGGGPETPAAIIDPDIEMIAPHLMAVAPTHFSSNMSVLEFDTSVNAINDILAQDTFNGNSTSVPASIIVVNNLSTEQVSVNNEVPHSSGNSEIQSQLSAPSSGSSVTKAQQTQPGKRKRRQISCSSNSSESDARSDRIKMIMNHEEDLHNIKIKFELEIMQEKKGHLKRMHALEERAALARALFAELELENARKKFSMED